MITVDERTNGARLLPGMPVEAAIRTRDRALLAYLTAPLMRHLSRAMRQT